MEIDNILYAKLVNLGIINEGENNNIRNHNIGNSDYSRHIIQPWSIWLDYNLNPFDADIIKRVLRTKEGESRKQDYEKIIHICQERIRQIDTVYLNDMAESVKFTEEDINFEEVI